MKRLFTLSKLQAKQDGAFGVREGHFWSRKLMLEQVLDENFCGKELHNWQALLLPWGVTDWLFFLVPDPPPRVGSSRNDRKLSPRAKGTENFWWFLAEIH